METLRSLTIFEDKLGDKLLDYAVMECVTGMHDKVYRSPKSREPKSLGLG